jgi:hypothetical protein
MLKKSTRGSKKLSRKSYNRSLKKISKLIMRGGEDRMKVRFFPIIKSSTIKDDYRFRDVMRWLSPDKMLGLIQHVFSGPGPDYIPTDIYWSINFNTGIPDWPIGTIRRNNFEKAIRNLQRLISEWPQITHFTISDNSVTNTYHKIDDNFFEDYVDIYDGMD